jgi:hypothetical protein
LTDWNDEKIKEYVGEHDCEIRMVQHSTKCGVKIIAVKKNIQQRLGLSHAPYQKKETIESFTVVHWRAGISVGRGWLGNGMIGRADGIRAVSAIDTNATLGFAYGPLERVEE